MGDADLLHRAATAMRERAQVATPGPWLIEPDGYDESEGWNDPYSEGFHLKADDSGPGTVYIARELHQGHSDGEADAEYIASWHPAVALAVANWLDSIATRHCDDGTEELVLHPYDPCEVCEGGGHFVNVCGGCYPTWEGEQARAIWPCREFNDALAVARAYLGEPADA